jgi:hypothetical protein
MELLLAQYDADGIRGVVRYHDVGLAITIQVPNGEALGMPWNR